MCTCYTVLMYFFRVLPIMRALVELHFGVLKLELLTLYILGVHRWQIVRRMLIDVFPQHLTTWIWRP